MKAKSSLRRYLSIIQGGGGNRQLAYLRSAFSPFQAHSARRITGRASIMSVRHLMPLQGTGVGLNLPIGQRKVQLERMRLLFLAQTIQFMVL